MLSSPLSVLFCHPYLDTISFAFSITVVLKPRGVLVVTGFILALVTASATREEAGLGHFTIIVNKKQNSAMAKVGTSIRSHYNCTSKLWYDEPFLPT